MSAIKPLYIQALAMAAPGLPDWAAAVPVLRGEQPYIPSPLAKFKPSLLPANEARRATPLVRLAFQVAEAALHQYQQHSPDKAEACVSQLASVFTSSGGDMDVIHRLCSTIANNPAMISPTYFHNSVHNAPAGYWSIATASMQASTSICAGADSFGMGLLEAALQLVHGDVLLVSYDTAITPPLYAKKPVSEPFASAWWLSAEPSEHSMAGLQIELVTAADAVPSSLSDPELEALRLDNPSARSLPLLAQLAKGQQEGRQEDRQGEQLDADEFRDVILPITPGQVMRVRSFDVTDATS